MQFVTLLIRLEFTHEWIVHVTVLKDLSVNVEKLDSLCRHTVRLHVTLLVVQLDRSFMTSLANVPCNSLDEVDVLFVHLHENFIKIVGTCLAFFLTKNASQSTHKRGTSLNQLSYPTICLAAHSEKESFV